VCTVHHPAVLSKLSTKQATHTGTSHISVFSLHCIHDNAPRSDTWPVRRLPWSLSKRRHVSLLSVAVRMSPRKLLSVRSTQMRPVSRTATSVGMVSEISFWGEVEQHEVVAEVQRAELLPNWETG
jgi:hypothetical protein